MLFPYSHRHCFAFTPVVFCGAIFQIHIPNIQNPCTHVPSSGLASASVVFGGVGGGACWTEAAAAARSSLRPGYHLVTTNQTRIISSYIRFSLQRCISSADSAASPSVKRLGQLQLMGKEWPGGWVGGGSKQAYTAAAPQ